MKKLLSGVTGIVILMSVLTGCGSAKKDVGTSNQNINTASSTDNKASTTQSNSNTATQTDNKKASGTSLSGEVTTIDGNKITLKVIESPQPVDGGKAPSGNAPGQNGGAPAQNSNTPNQNGNSQSQNSSAAAQGTNSTAQSGKAPDSNGAPQTKYTGETQTITIAEGTAITSLNPSASTDSDKEKTIAVKDIKVGDRLNIIYSGSDKTTISKINVMSQNSK